jgi:colicin import membrane protein
LEAWGAESNLFHQGITKESEDPEVVAATMAKPGVILRRPVGSNGPFTEHAALPTDLANDEVNGRPKRARARPKKQPPRKTDDKAARQAALEYERAERQRETERRKEETARAKERQRREQAIATAQAALETGA